MCISPSLTPIHLHSLARTSKQRKLAQDWELSKGKRPKVETLCISMGSSLGKDPADTRIYLILETWKTHGRNSGVGEEGRKTARVILKFHQY